MASSMSAVCDELGIGLGCVLEGGYDLDALASSVAATMGAIVPAPDRAARPRPAARMPPERRTRHALVSAAPAGSRRYWPSLLAAGR